MRGLVMNSDNFGGKIYLQIQWNHLRESAYVGNSNNNGGPSKKKIIYYWARKVIG